MEVILAMLEKALESGAIEAAITLIEIYIEGYPYQET